MHGLNYSYDVRITRGSNILSTGPLSNALPNCGEMIITSKIFDEYMQCEQSLSSLLSNLTRHQTMLSDVNHVIVTKRNPNHHKTDKPDPEAADWDNATLLRAYVAEAAALKKAELRYNIIGQIKINEKQLEAIRSLAPTTVS